MLGLDGVAGITFNDASAQGTSALSSGRVPSSYMPTGSVVQVVAYSSGVGSTFATSSSTPVSSGFSASISPKFSASRILILVDTQLRCGTSSGGVGLTLYRGGSAIRYPGYDGSGYLTNYCYSNPGNWNQTSMTFVDSPGTTSSTTYSLYLSCYNGSTVTMSGGGSGNYYPTTITLMEISS